MRNHYPEYDGLTGYVTKTYSTEWLDTQGNLWRKTCTVINLGRPDRGIVGDVDAQLVEEHWGHGNSYAGPEAMRRKGEENRASLRMEMVAHLREHGPQQAQGIAMDLQRGYRSIAKQLSDNEGMVFCRAGYGNGAVLWGVLELEAE
jgi:hypothetical protein